MWFRIARRPALKQQLRSSIRSISNGKARFSSSIICSLSIIDSQQTTQAWWKYVGAGILGLVCYGHSFPSAYCEKISNESAPTAPGERDPSLPTYSLQEVSQHTGVKRKGIWVVYKNGVYDITKFITSHPGGTKILLAAGKSIEPFWQLYAAHNNVDVYKILESLRIGNLKEEDVIALEKERKARYGDGPYSHDPTRHPALKVNSSQPFNAEPPPELLMESFITPNDLFFVRNHLPVPEVDTENFKLKISGLGLPSGMMSILLFSHLVLLILTASNDRNFFYFG
jgi:sulfite oxidase